MKAVYLILATLLIVALSGLGCDESDDETTPATTQLPPITVQLPSSPTPTPDPVPEKLKLDLSVGEVVAYSFSEAEAVFGNTGYEVISKEDVEGVSVYTLETTLKLEASTSCGKPTEVTATVKLDEFFTPISYESAATIGSG